MAEIRHVEQELQHRIVAVPEAGDRSAVGASAACGDKRRHHHGSVAVDDPVRIARVVRRKGCGEFPCQIEQAADPGMRGGEQLVFLAGLPDLQKPLLHIPLVGDPGTRKAFPALLLDVWAAGLFRLAAMMAERVPGHLLQA